MKDEAIDYSEHYANFKRGNALMHLKRHREAIGYYTRALGSSPWLDASAHCNLSVCWSGQQQYGKAKRSAEAALQINPESTIAWHALAMAFDGNGDRKKSLDAIDQALKLNPTEIASIAFKVHLLCDWNKLAEARETYHAGLQLSPENTQILHSAARTCILSNQFDLAKQFLDVSLKINPESSEVHYYLGCHWNGKNNFKEAESAFKEALRLDPENTVARKLLNSLPMNSFGSKPIEATEACLLIICTVAYVVLLIVVWPELQSEKTKQTAMWGVFLLPVLIHGLYGSRSAKKQEAGAQTSSKVDPNEKPPPTRE